MRFKGRLRTGAIGIVRVFAAIAGDRRNTFTSSSGGKSTIGTRLDKQEDHHGLAHFVRRRDRRPCRRSNAGPSNGPSSAFTLVSPSLGHSRSRPLASSRTIGTTGGWHHWHHWHHWY
jgi:hypothetical protein